MNKNKKNHNFAKQKQQFKKMRKGIFRDGMLFFRHDNKINLNMAKES